jgi:hypothetical protein
MRNHIKPRNAAGHSGGVMLKLRSQYNLPTTAAATAATAATAPAACITQSLIVARIAVFDVIR